MNKILTFILVQGDKRQQKRDTFLPLHEKKTTLKSQAASALAFPLKKPQTELLNSNLTSSSSNIPNGGTGLKMKKLTPNYTKSTTSTDARRRGKNLKMDRAPCSYSRCSLNEHRFVSARRQAQARPTKGSGKLIGRDEAATSDGDMWSDIDPRSETEILRRQMKEESGEQHEFIMSSSDERLGNFFDEISVSQEFFDEESLNSDTLFHGEEHEESLPNEDHPLEHDQECNAVHQVNPRNMEMPETEDKTSIQAAVKHDMSNLQEADEPTCFNPHFLPLEADPEAEKVRLRHQEVDARKNGEEWMVDYALREAIGPTRHRKVASLVEAFERLLPTTKT